MFKHSLASVLPTLNVEHILYRMCDNMEVSQPKSRLDLWIQRYVVNTLYLRKIVSSFSFYRNFSRNFHLFSTFGETAFRYISCVTVSLVFMVVLFRSFGISFCLHLFYCKHYSADIILWYARGVAPYILCHASIAFALEHIRLLCVSVTYDFSNGNQIKCLRK